MMGMGLEFTELDYDELLALEDALIGVPPPLGRRRQPVMKRTVTREWVEAKICWEEDLGDRVNTFEFQDAVSAIDIDTIDFAAEGALLTSDAITLRRSA